MLYLMYCKNCIMMLIRIYLVLLIKSVLARSTFGRAKPSTAPDIVSSVTTH